MINSYPQIPVDAIKKSEKDTNKLDIKTAAKINVLIQNRIKAKADAMVGKEAEEQNKVCTDANYKVLQDILQKAATNSLTEADIAQLNKILKNPGTKTEEE